MATMPDLSYAQLSAVEEVKNFTDSSSQIRLIAMRETNRCVALNIEIDTSDFARRVGGLEARPRERVTVVIAPDYPTTPPQTSVEHLRWAGFPHVLQGMRLCIYLDPGTEWDPTRGMQGFLLRLWEWFEDAIGGRFDPTTALFHPVGGVLHRTPGAPTVVATLAMPADVVDEGVVRRIGLRPRTDHRIDVAAWKAPYESGLVPGLLVVLPEYLPFGGGYRLSDLLAIVRQQLDRIQRRSFETSLRRTIRSLGGDKHLHVIIAVPNPASGVEVPKHLIGWRLCASDATEALVAARSADSLTSGGEEPEVEWTYIDDQRPEVAVRRDSERPVTVYARSRLAVWGCGALGSWIAELLVRAGARGVILRDPGFVTRGLLVRQNYIEEDVGRPKVEALAERLRTSVRHMRGHGNRGSCPGRARRGRQELRLHLRHDHQHCSERRSRRRAAPRDSRCSSRPDGHRQPNRNPRNRHRHRWHTGRNDLRTGPGPAPTGRRRSEPYPISDVLESRRPSAPHARARLLCSDLPWLRSRRHGHRSIRRQRCCPSAVPPSQRRLSLGAPAFAFDVPAVTSIAPPFEETQRVA